MKDGAILPLNYQGNSRRVIPLAFGTLKNGKEALLCYKVEGEDLAIRLYHTSKISRLGDPQPGVSFDRKIDYYLTKHFRSIQCRV